MTAKIFSKDLRLAAHPMMYVFALFGAMLIIPNYPYTVVFFYGLLRDEAKPAPEKFDTSVQLSFL